jgi:hypothetical protein
MLLVWDTAHETLTAFLSILACEERIELPDTLKGETPAACAGHGVLGNLMVLRTMHHRSDMVHVALIHEIQDFKNVLRPIFPKNVSLSDLNILGKIS